MANINHLQGSDTLKVMYPKVNANLDNLNTDIATNATNITALTTTVNTNKSSADSQSTTNAAAITAGDNAVRSEFAAADTAHAGNSTAHNATAIVFTPGTSGIASTNVDGAIKELKTGINNVASGGSVLEISDAHLSGNGGTNYANLKARMDAEEMGPKANLQTNDKTSGVNAVNETINFAAAIDAARADLARQQYYSGVVDYVSGATVTATPAKGAIGTSATVANTLYYGAFSANVNGYKINIPAGSVTIPAAPTYGYREDLAFLEGWFPTTGTRGQFSWRVRTVAGVDFAKYSEGFDTTGDANPLVQPQGGNASPLNVAYNWVGTDNYFKYASFFGKGNRNTYAANFSGKSVSLDDIGLYIAGDGSSTSKSTLATLDGYVYAIPLFRIKRRNSGGYRKDNPNGARDYYSGNGTFSWTQNSSLSSFTFSSSIPVGLQIGDIVKVINTNNGAQFNTSPGSKVVSISGSTVTLQDAAVTTAASGTLATGQLSLVSDHPSGLYSNIIDAEDIRGGDLRHRIPVTFNPSGETESGFDTLLRGQLTTKDAKLLQKDAYGLRKAPLGLVQALQATTIKRNDGTFFDETNLVGATGNGNSLLGLTQGNSYGTAAWTADGKYRVTTSGATYSQTLVFPPFFADTSKYYLICFTYQTDTGLVWGTNTDSTTTIASQRIINAPSTTETTLYVKYVPSSSGNIWLKFIKNSGGTYLYLDNIRVIPISQSEYNLIDVDANWTGGDKIAALYPYVDSYPNFVENVCPTDIASWVQGSINSGTGADSTTTIALRTGLYPIRPSTTYSFQRSVSLMALYFYDSSGTYISTSNTGTVTTPSNATQVRFTTQRVDGATVTSSDILTLAPQVEAVNTGINYPNPFVPTGRYYLDKDYLANGHMVQSGTLPTYHYAGVNGGNFTGQRLVFSDAQSSQTNIDLVDPTWNGVNRPKHVIPTQATAGIWTNGDTVKLHSDDGVITASGAVVTRITSASTGTGTTGHTMTVADVTGISVSDTFNVVGDTNIPSSTTITITAVDSSTNTITFTSSASIGVGQWQADGTRIVKTNVSPTVKLSDGTTVVVGTWAGLGTKDATFTITTAPTPNTSIITITSSVNYPAGKGISQVATDVLKAEVNGREVLASNTVSVKANFVGKVSGNTDAVPHKAFGKSDVNTLAIPSAFTVEFVGGYASSSSLDGTLVTTNAFVSGNIAEQLYQFDLIRGIEDVYGEIPADGTAAKVVWLKANISTLEIDWYGNGSGPSGNSATWSAWNGSSWATIASNTASSPSKLVATWNNPGFNSYIDANGYWYGLAYAPASDGVTASTINTDYVELSITLNTALKSAFDGTSDASGYTVLQPTNPFPVMSENILTANQAFPVDVSGFSTSSSFFLASGATISIDTSQTQYGYGALKVVTDGLANFEGVENSSLTVSAYANSYYTASAKFKGTSGQSYRMTLRDYTNSVTLGTYSFTGTGQWQTISVSGKTGSNVVTDLRMAVSIASAVTDTSWITQLKIQQNVTATDWSAGRQRKKTLNFLGKVAGSTVENPHNFRFQNSATFDSPSIILTNPNRTQTDYDGISKQDGVLTNYLNPATGQYAQQLFEFDLSHLGMTTKELKAAFRRIDLTWVGYGSGDNAGTLTYGATVKIWDGFAWNSWATNTSSAPSSTTAGSTSNTYVMNTQKIYVLVYSTYPASATNPSNIYTDYIKLDVTLADYVDYVPANIVKVRPETKELKTWFPAKSARYLGGNPGEAEQIALYYRYVPYQGQGSIAKSRILAVGTPIITTLGTGAYPSDSQFAGISAMSTRLPSPVADYSLIVDKFTSEGVLTTTDSLTLKQNPLTTVAGNGYKLTPKPGMYFDVVGTTSETVIRGATGKITLSTDAIASINGQATYKFNIPASLPSEAIIALPMLIVDNGELKLVVVSFRKSKSSVLQYYSTDGVYDHFRISGRPLVKGV